MSARRLAPLLALLGAPAAYAGPTLGLDLDVAAPIDGSEGAPTMGADLRLGYGIELAVVRFVPEAGLRFTPGAPLVPELGGRVLVGKVLEPGAYGYVLLPLSGHRDITSGWEAGGLLDLTAVPGLDIGVHLGVTQVQLLHDLGAERSLGGGLHVALRM